MASADNPFDDCESEKGMKRTMWRLVIVRVGDDKKNTNDEDQDNDGNDSDMNNDGDNNESNYDDN